MAKTPTAASAWLTIAVGLKAFSHCGFLVNFQVCIFRASLLAMFEHLAVSNIPTIFLTGQEIAPQYSGVLHGKFFVLS